MFLSVFAILIVTQKAIASDTSMLFDPGPSFYCWEYTNTADGGSPVNTTKTTSDCPHFAGTGHSGSSWFTDQYGWVADEQKQYPGYDVEVAGTSGTPLAVTLTNNARTRGDCGVTVFEVAFTYLYDGFSFTKQPNGWEYNLNDYEEILVDYDIEIVSTTPADSSYACKYQRNYITTDFIYYYNTTCHSTAINCDAEYKRVFSLKHFDPTNNNIDDPTDQKFQNACPSAGFCSLQVNEELRLSASPGTQHMSLEFKGLIEKWSAALNHSDGSTSARGVPATAKIYAIQLVSSNVENDSTVKIGNVTAVMRKN